MKPHRIRVQIEFKQIDGGKGSLDGEPKKVGNGCFEIDLPSELVMDIDGCEQALMAANFPALRDALGTHLEEMSRQRALQERAVQDVPVEVGEHPSPYRVDGEIGRFTFGTHDVADGEGKVCFTTKDLFPTVKGIQYYETKGFKEVGMLHGTVDVSYRKVAERLNRQRRQEEGGTPLNTLRDTTEAEGQKVVNFWEETTSRLFEENGFDKDGEPSPGAVVEHDDHYESGSVSAEDLEEAIAAAQIPEELKDEVNVDPGSYERVEETVEIAVDGVSTKKQKDHRSSSRAEQENHPEQTDGGKDRTKRVNNRIGYVEHNGQSYTFAAWSYVQLLRFVLAFLLNLNLWKKTLCFHVDGERSLRDAITKLFAWHPNVKFFLDWYHLHHKCAELLSSASKGRKIRNRYLDKLSWYLWYGCVDSAIGYLAGIPAGEIKNLDALNHLVQYVQKHRSSIPCYAIRKQLGLRNSSNRVEKDNDLLVSQRQKRNGMSWSEEGSLGLAAVTAVRRNNHQRPWLDNNVIPFTFGSCQAKSA